MAEAPDPEPHDSWSDRVRRLRRAATTEPGRLRIISVVVAVLVMAFGSVTAWQVSDRSDGATRVVPGSQQLSADAASLYRSLADADTTAAAGFLSEGQWSPEIRERYQQDIDRASELLVKAAADSHAPGSARTQIDRISQQLPVYTGLVEQARANNRQGLPLGGAYLRYANERMRTELLPAARALYEAETAQLQTDHRKAMEWPWFALGLGAAALLALGWAQRRDFLRTNRVFNRGLLAATAASTVVLLWLVAGHGLARSGLTDSYEYGFKSLQVLNEARISTLQARGDESLTLVARGAVLTDDGEDFYEQGYQAAMRETAGGSEDGVSPESLLGRAQDLANDFKGRKPVAEAVTGVREWRERHAAARATDESGDYAGALKKVIGAEGTTAECFDQVDASLKAALAHEQQEFKQAVERGGGALTALPTSAVLLALLGAVAAVLGVGRRLAEYR
nr:hypothetical protein [Streptomyces sp. TP-A0874]